MVTGTPVIARRAGGLNETIEHGVTGFLVDDLKEAELAVRHLEGLSRPMVRDHVIGQFLPARMVDAYETVYRRLVQARRERDASGRHHDEGLRLLAGRDLPKVGAAP